MLFRSEDGGDEEAEDEFGEALPDFAAVNAFAAGGCLSFPHGDGQDGDEESPDANEHVAPDNFHQGEGFRGGVMTDGFGSGESGSVGKFRGANPCACHARMQAEPAAGGGQQEDHDNCPDDDERDGHGDVFFPRTAGTADGDCAGHAADGTARAEAGSEAAVEVENAGGSEINAGEGDDGNDQRLADGSGSRAQDDGKRQGNLTDRKSVV